MNGVSIHKYAALVAVLAALLIALTAGMALAATKINCPTGNENRCVGTPNDDIISGTPERDVIKARSGNDEVRALASADRVSGGNGNDILFAGNGGDKVLGNQGSDELQAGRGNDTVLPGNDEQRDYVFCGPGNDVARIKANDIIDDEVSGNDLLGNVNTLLSCETVFVNGIQVLPVPVVSDEDPQP